MKNKKRSNSQGMVLIVALLFLLVLTSMSMVFFEKSILQIKMVENFSQSVIAFQRAESALKQAILGIMNPPKIPATENEDCYFSVILESCGGSPCYKIDAYGKEKKAVRHIQAMLVLHVIKNKNTEQIKYQLQNWHEMP